MRSSNSNTVYNTRSDFVLTGDNFDLHSYVKQFHALPNVTFWYSSLDLKAASICSGENV